MKRLVAMRLRRIAERLDPPPTVVIYGCGPQGFSSSSSGNMKVVYK